MGIQKNVKHEKFCQLITSGEDKKNSYIKAGYKVRGNVAETDGGRLFRNVQIKARLKELRRVVEKKYDLSKDSIYSILKSMLNADSLDVYLTTSRKELKKLPKALRLCIKSIADTKEGIRIEMYSKTQVIEIANKMLGHNSPDVVKYHFTFADIAAAAAE